MVRQNLSFAQMPISSASSAIVHQPFFEMPRPTGGRNRERVNYLPNRGRLSVHAENGADELVLQTAFHVLVQAGVGTAAFIVDRPGAELVYVALIVQQDLLHGIGVPGTGPIAHRQRQQEIVSDMELNGEEAQKTEVEKTAAESLLPPVEHKGVTITPLRLLGTKNKLYLILEIRAPEGTVFSPEDRYDLFDGIRVPEERRTEMLGSSGSFTVLEAGTREPNILVGAADTTASFDIGGCSYVVRALYRKTPDGEQETVFGGWDPETGPTDSWEFPIPEDLNQDQLLEPGVEGLSMTDGGKTMTLLSMSVSPLGVWWKYQLDGEDPWPRVRVALRMRDGSEVEARWKRGGSEVEAALGQLTMGDMGSGCTASVDFAKPVDLSQAEAMLALCAPVLAAPAKSSRHWKVYVDLGSIQWKGAKAAKANTKPPLWQPS